MAQWVGLTQGGHATSDPQWVHNGSSGRGTPRGAVGRAGSPPPSPAWGSEQRRAASLAGAASLAAPAQGPAACRLVDVFFLSL